MDVIPFEAALVDVASIQGCDAEGNEPEGMLWPVAVLALTDDPKTTEIFMSYMDMVAPAFIAHCEVWLPLETDANDEFVRGYGGPTVQFRIIPRDAQQEAVCEALSFRVPLTYFTYFMSDICQYGVVGFMAEPLDDEDDEATPRIFMAAVDIEEAMFAELFAWRRSMGTTKKWRRFVEQTIPLV